MVKDKPQIIEKTRKRYKLQMLVGGLMFCVGIALVVVGIDSEGPKKLSSMSMNGILTAAAGFMWYAAARLAGWWSHG